MMKNKRSKLVGALSFGGAIFSMVFLQSAFAQTPIDASNGIDFGAGADDPAMGKNLTSDNLDVGLSSDGSFSIYSGGDAFPYFKAGRGNAANVAAGKWYRIAQAVGGLRANAEFTLMDNISGGGHSTAVFKVGMSYNGSSSMGFTLLSHTYYGPPTFTNVRILRKSTYDPFYLEVFVNRPGDVRYAVTGNLTVGGWIPVDWTETASVPAGYSVHQYNINKLFVVGRTQNIFSIGFDESVEVNGSLSVLGSPVVTQSTATSLLAGQYIPFNGVGSSGSFLMEGVNGGAGLIPAEGEGARMMWYPEKAAFRVGEIEGSYWQDDWNDEHIGTYSMALGHNVRASGVGSVALGSGGHAIGDYSTVMGNNSQATGNYSAAIGVNCSTYGDASLSVGTGTEAIGFASFASGMETSAYASFSTAMGVYTEAESYGSLVIGSTNLARVSAAGQTSWIGDDQNSVFEIGIGGNGSAKNALTVLQDGSIELGKATATDNSVPLHIKADGSVILSKAQGDISMGVFGQ